LLHPAEKKEKGETKTATLRQRKSRWFPHHHARGKPPNSVPDDDKQRKKKKEKRNREPSGAAAMGPIHPGCTGGGKKGEGEKKKKGSDGKEEKWLGGFVANQRKKKGEATRRMALWGVGMLEKTWT